MSSARLRHQQALATLGKARIDASSIWRPGTATEWDISGRCETPLTLERFSRCPEGLTPNAWLILTVPCRKCAWCLRRRGRMWIDRAKIETASSARTWFGTLTFTEQHQTTALMSARVNAYRSANDFDTMGRRDQFVALVREHSPKVTSWLKRVRKESDTRFRYLVVAEHHKSGLPHFHFLLHELVGCAPVRKEIMRRQWAMNGFSHQKLVVNTEESPRAVHYVCKYLMKTSAARVRASRFYGRPWDELRPKAIVKPESAETCPF